MNSTLIREILAMTVAFAFLIYAMNRTKIQTGITILLTGLILAVAAGQTCPVMLDSFTAIFTSLTKLRTMAVVLQIGMLSALMKHYGILDAIVESFQQVFASPRTIIMLLPAAFGTLSVPGGAQLSSPFAWQLGETLGMPVSDRAAVNLAFRHIAHFLLPTSSGIIVFSSLAPHVSVYQLFALNLGFVLAMECTAYWCYLRPHSAPASSVRLNRPAGILNLAKYLLPIYFVLICNGIFKINICMSVFLSIALTLLLWGRSDLRRSMIVLAKSFNVKVLVMLTGVYFMQNTIQRMDALMACFTALFTEHSGFGVLFFIALAAILLGFSTGLNYAPVGVLLPLLVGLHLPAKLELIYCFFIYTWSFTGYYFSPLHLCQLLTVQQMNCGSAPLYKTYRPLVAAMTTAPFVLFYVYRALLGA